MRMLAMGLLGLAATGALGSGRGNVATARDTAVAVKTFQFRPTSLVVPRGTRVVWSNGDEIEHTVTAGSPDSAGGEFTGTMKTLGSTFTHRFNRAGTFSYFCDRHHFMRGEIRVTPTGEN